MARRRSRRRKNSYSEDSVAAEASHEIVVEELSPRARRLVESGVIDLGSIAGSGADGKITSGDILHAARVMEMEQAVPRIERAGDAEPDLSEAESAAVSESPEPDDHLAAPPPIEDAETPISGTSTTAQVGGVPISVPPDPWDAYNGSTEGLSESALPGAEQSWGEAEANIVAIAEEAAQAAGDTETQVPGVEDEAVPGIEEPGVPEIEESDVSEIEEDPASSEVAEVPLASDIDALAASGHETHEHHPAEPEEESESVAELVEAANAALVATSDQATPSEDLPALTDVVDTEQRDDLVPAVPAAQREVMMDFGTLELVDPESVWAEGAEDFAPWFLAHSQQLGDVLGLEAGLSDARQFTTKSATGVVGRDDNGEDVVVVSSQNATADDSDLGRALGMAASSGASSVALVSAALQEDQLKALAWLNNQTKSGVRWYGIEMRVVRIADSPAAMLFDLVASPSTE